VLVLLSSAAYICVSINTYFVYNSEHFVCCVLMLIESCARRRLQLTEPNHSHDCITQLNWLDENEKLFFIWHLQPAWPTEQTGKTEHILTLLTHLVHLFPRCRLQYYILLYNHKSMQISDTILHVEVNNIWLHSARTACSHLFFVSSINFFQGSSNILSTQS